MTNKLMENETKKHVDDIAEYIINLCKEMIDTKDQQNARMLARTIESTSEQLVSYLLK